MSVAMFMSAIASAVGQGFDSLSADPLLVWNYGAVGVLAFVGGIGFWFTFRKLDIEEDHLNMLPVGHLEAAPKDIDEPAPRREASQMF
jgi:proton-dependent oligopeptide transporter, POT family